MKHTTQNQSDNHKPDVSKSLKKLVLRSNDLSNQRQNSPRRHEDHPTRQHEDDVVHLPQKEDDDAFLLPYALADKDVGQGDSET
mmetsp:Transcript_28564/g.42042  ORF Transcript_28564/g.42042 Transcript_28564/m.42042 type:complete len:84 (+) Transcript_28564:779-1030(+)